VVVEPAPFLPEATAGLAPSLLDDQEQWVAPAEAKASGFMEFADESIKKTPVAAVQAKPEFSYSTPDEGADLPQLAAALVVGSWLELEIRGHWQRTQLSWISPHSTMYLFTSGQGKSQSMTQRMLDRLLAAGKLRILSDQASMVDGALDAVVHTALLNSIDLVMSNPPART
jgi:hypothetical protein